MRDARASASVPSASEARARAINREKNAKITKKREKNEKKNTKLPTAHDCSRIARARYARARSRIAKNTGVQQLKLLKYRCAATKIAKTARQSERWVVQGGRGAACHPSANQRRGGVNRDAE